MNDSMEQELHRFITSLLIEQPFYGDILLKLPIVRDDSVPTACTDGRTIRWSGKFFGPLNENQRHYVLMHEVFHTLLMHPLRRGSKDPEIWNVAADLVVNAMCDELATYLNYSSSPATRLQRPPNGLFAAISPDITADTLYELIQQDNKGRSGRKLLMRRHYWNAHGMPNSGSLVDALPPPPDLLTSQLSEEEAAVLQQEMRELLKSAMEHVQGDGAASWMPARLAELLKVKPLNWKSLLRDFLSEAQSDDTSYATPERKYLHMDMILPGHGLSEDDELDSVWAFIDSSGSISQEEMDAFLTQMYHLVKEFHCEMNIAYWSTSVTDVYRKIRSEKQVLQSLPRHSGGTDINCVYRWVQEQKLRPWVSLILTDGAYGHLQEGLQRALPRRSTILVLSNHSQNPEYRRVGKVARLSDK